MSTVTYGPKDEEEPSEGFVVRIDGVIRQQFATEGEAIGRQVTLERALLRLDRLKKYRADNPPASGMGM